VTVVIPKGLLRCILFEVPWQINEQQVPCINRVNS